MFTKPLTFRPYFKSVIWGGDKIAGFKGVDTGVDCVGESWEISAVPGHESVVVGDPAFDGKNLARLCADYGPELLGSAVYSRCGAEFPLLIKIIDARQNLSVQVHPDDALAKARHDSAGKTEMWYIIDCEPGANIYTGISAPLTPDEYRRRVADDTIMDVVAAHKSAPGQFYFVPAGTIHAIGAGNLLAEVQQSSDITYRVYDYNRRDADGNPRELHTELATDAIDYTFPNCIKPTAEVFDHTVPGAVTSRYFKTDFVKCEAGGTFDVDTKGESFAIIIVTGGNVTLTMDGGSYDYHQGMSVLVPAEICKFSLSGYFTALSVTC